MTVINDLPFYYSTLNSIGSWLAENDSKHALFIKIKCYCLWFRFFGIHVKAYIYVMYLEILNMEVLMLRSLGPLIRSGMVLCSDE